MFDVAFDSAVDHLSTERPWETVEAVEAGLGAGSCIPPGLDEMRPGPVLAAFLSSIDMGELSGADRVAVLRAHHRMASHHQANAYAAMASIRDAYTDLRRSEGRDAHSQFDAEDAAAEIRAALSLTRRSADIEVSFALTLAERLPEVYRHLLSGTIDIRRARTIDNQTIDLPIDTARALATRILPNAESLTTGQIRAALSRMRMEVRPDEAALRYTRARDERRIILEPTPEGTAHIHALHLAPQKAQAIMRSLSMTARSLRGDAEPRSTDQLRADVFVDALMRRNAKPAIPGGPDGSAGRADSSASAGIGTRAQGDRRGTVHLHADLDTLAALSDHPGELQGYGPVIADVARLTALENLDAEWRFTVTNTGTGEHVSGTTKRRPTESQRRSASIENPTCAFPGCRMPAPQCDLDHIVAWEDGGATEPVNLAPLCRFDHQIKHRAGWTYAKRRRGNIVWMTPLGLRHETMDIDPWKPRPRRPDPPE